MATQLVFAADALIRFMNGRILIHTTGSKLAAFESAHPLLVGYLCQFARPTPPEALVAGLRPPDQATLMSAIDYLRRSGVLVEAELPAAREPEPAESTGLSQQHLRQLARNVYEISCDVLAFGPHAEQALRERTGIGLERRLLAMLAGLDALRRELAGLNPHYLQSQLKSLKLDTAAKDHKLHIGCGKCLLEGWINIDIHPAPLSLNVLRGLPFPDGSVGYVFVSHLLEHLFYPADVKPFLAEIHRVLAPGGVVRVVVPDIERCIDAYVADDRVFFESRRETWSWWPQNATRLEDFLAYAGVGAEPAFMFESHKYGYDFETLARTLRDAGFQGVIRSEFMASQHEALRVDCHSDVASARYGDRHYSLFVEGQRPV